MYKTFYLPDRRKYKGDFLLLLFCNSIGREKRGERKKNTSCSLQVDKEIKIEREREKEES